MAHPSTHPWVGCLNKSIISRSIWFLVFWQDPTHYSIHLLTYRWGCLHKSKIFKQNWIISIKASFIWLLVIWHDPTHKPTKPLLGGGLGVQKPQHMCVCMHMYTHTHVKHVVSHLQFLNMYLLSLCTCVCVVCVCVYVCGALKTNPHPCVLRPPLL